MAGPASRVTRILLKKSAVKFPILVLMLFCRKEKVHRFAGATELLQLLDQVFVNLHKCYNIRTEELFDGDHISKEGFMSVL